MLSSDHLLQYNSCAVIHRINFDGAESIKNRSKMLFCYAFLSELSIHKSLDQFIRICLCNVTSLPSLMVFDSKHAGGKFDLSR